MSEAQEIDSPIAESEENINNSNSTILPVEDHITKDSSNEEETQKSESIEVPRNCLDKRNDSVTLVNDDTPKMDNSPKREDSIVIDDAPKSPTAKTLELNKAGECNLLPVLVERLRSALEQSCSSQSSSSNSEDHLIQPEDSGVDSEEDLRVWASGLCKSMEHQQQEEQQNFNDSTNSRGLKLDLKFLEDLLQSDIQTALGRLQETLKRTDIGALTRYSSTLDPTNKLNLLKLISSLLANLKIPEEESIVKPEKTFKNASSVVTRRRRADRHTIAVTSEELARARKWLDEKSIVTSSVVEPKNMINSSKMEIDGERNLENFKRQENLENITMEDSTDRLDSQINDKQYEKLPEKYMKDALNQQQSLQNKSVKDITSSYNETTVNNQNGTKNMDNTYNDDNTIINEEYGISASTLYHQTNAQAKCNKFLAKKSKIKRANTIDIPNYLKLQAESMANGHGGGGLTLRRPINIGDKYTCNGGNVIPSFEPKTENDRKFLALINKNNDNTSCSVTASSSLPFKSFNYRQAATVADKNWNSRFSNIKTTFDKPRVNDNDENTLALTRDNTNETRKKSHAVERDVVVGSLKIACNGSNQKFPTFSHASTSPFQKIEKPERDEKIGSFLKSGYMPKNGSTLRAKVKMFDQENVDNSSIVTNSPLPTRSRNKQQFNGKRGSNMFLDANGQNVMIGSEKSKITENGHLNYHTFCKQFAPFATKNPVENPRSGPWSSKPVVNTANKTQLIDKRQSEKFQTNENKITAEFSDDNDKNAKVPVTYRSSDLHETNNDRKEKSRHRKLYEKYDGPTSDNGTTNSRDIVAYPFEINYQKRPTFGKKYHDVRMEKCNYDNTEDIQQHRLPSSALNYANKTIVPSSRNPSPPPPPRGIFSMQSVAVQTQQIEPVRTIYPNENRSNFASRQDETLLPRRNIAGSSLSKEMALSVESPNEETRRHVDDDDDDDDDTRAGASRNYNDDVYRQFSCKRDTDLSQFAAPQQSNYGVQGRQQALPQNVTVTSHASHQANYPSSMDYKRQYYPSLEHETYSLENSLVKPSPLLLPASSLSSPPPPPPPQIPVRANPPQSQISSIPKNQREQNENYEKYDKSSYNEIVKPNIIHDYHDYDKIFYRDKKNPIYVPPNRNIVETQNFNENSTINQLPVSHVIPSIIHHSTDNYNPDVTRCYVDDGEIADLSEEHSFIDDENIQNQDISTTEGVVTRYACAIATVSPVPESPIVSPLLASSEENPDTRTRLYDEESARSIKRDSRDHEASYPMTSTIYRDERERENEDLSLEQIRRHNLLQQNLIKKLQNEQSSSVVPNFTRRLSQETSYRADDATSSRDVNYPINVQTDQSLIPKITRRSSQDKSYREEATSNDLNYSMKSHTDESVVPKITRRLSQEKPHSRDDKKFSGVNYPSKFSCDDVNANNDEPVIESNNTQDKINIFEGRNNLTKKHHQQFKPLSIIPRVDRTDNFVTPKINIVSPSKVFKPSFKGDYFGLSGVGRSIGGIKLPQKISNSVDSSDEYLMSCASKPSRSIVLSKSESWHQLALSKSTLQVPKAPGTCGLLKPPKPKSPSSVKLSKQYEASSSSDNIRKMEEKIQRYFQGSSSVEQNDSSIAAEKKESRTKRNFNTRKNSGILVRSHTMPHIYDETADVEKAFDSLFKEATRTDNRY